ncbi:hypothetical protein L916_15042, partial [Phytophthora nicotianae]
ATLPRSTCFSADNVHVLSCSDDKTARYWDLPTAKPLCLSTCARQLPTRRLTMLVHVTYQPSGDVTT